MQAARSTSLLVTVSPAADRLPAPGNQGIVPRHGKAVADDFLPCRRRYGIRDMRPRVKKGLRRAKRSAGRLRSARRDAPSASFYAFGHRALLLHIHISSASAST